MKIDYDSQERVARVTLPDGNSYSFRYGAMHQGMNSWAEIAGPRFQSVRIALSGTSYSIEQVNSAEGNTAPPENSGNNQKSSALVDQRPLAGSIVGHTYTNKFFDFSIDFPENWAVVLVDEAAKQDTRATAYALLAVGSRDKQMNGTRSITIFAARPRGSGLSATAAQNLAQNETNGLNLLAPMGLGRACGPLANRAKY